MAFMCHGADGNFGLRPNDFGYDWMIARSAARGFRYMHLGGGEPSLLRYKAKFSDARVSYYVARHVFNQDKYDALSVDSKVPYPSESRSFPAYRAS
jgi:hypothetical protein